MEEAQWRVWLVVCETCSVRFALLPFFLRHLIVGVSSAQVDGLGIREFRAGRVYDVGGGGRPNLQHVGGSAIYVRTGEYPIAERREATRIWGGKLKRWGTSVGGR
jgi:hypothetical protein